METIQKNVFLHHFSPFLHTLSAYSTSPALRSEGFVLLSHSRPKTGGISRTNFAPKLELAYSATPRFPCDDRVVTVR